MHDEDGQFGDRVAAYDESAPEMFESGVVELAVDVLADHAGSGRALERAELTGFARPSGLVADLPRLCNRRFIERGPWSHRWLG